VTVRITPCSLVLKFNSAATQTPKAHMVGVCANMMMDRKQLSTHGGGIIPSGQCVVNICTRFRLTSAGFKRIMKPSRVDSRGGDSEPPVSRKESHVPPSKLTQLLTLVLIVTLVACSPAATPIPPTSTPIPPTPLPPTRPTCRRLVPPHQHLLSHPKNAGACFRSVRCGRRESLPHLYRSGQPNRRV